MFSPRLIAPALLAAILSQPATIGRTVLATVLDERGRATVDVDADDFVVREAGQPREVLTARVADYPVAVLLDVSDAAAADLPALKAAASRFIERIGDRPIALATIGAHPRLAADFDTPRAAVLERLGALQPDPGAPLPIEALVQAARAIVSAGAPFSSMVVVSAAPAGASPAATSALAEIVASGAIVHVIERQARAGVRALDDLQTLTQQTHGQFTAVYTPASYPIALDHLADRLSTEMLVEYLTASRQPVAADAVTVGVKRPGARVVGLGVR